MRILGLLTLFLFLLSTAVAQLEPPTDLYLTYLTENEIVLEWTAPAEMDPINYWLFRDDFQIDILDSTSTTQILPQPGSFDYHVRAFYDGGPSAPSNEVTASWFGENGSSFFETFDSGLPPSWSTEPVNTTATWTWEVEPLPGTFDSPHLRVYQRAIIPVGVQSLISPELDFSVSLTVEFTFDHYMTDSQWGTEDCRVQYSFDRTNWVSFAIYQDETIELETVVTDLTAQLAGQENVWFRFRYDSDSFLSNGDWRIDNVIVDAAVPNEDPIVLDLVPFITDIPAAGGIVYYDAFLTSTLNQTIRGAEYATYVRQPNGQVSGPLSRSPVTITPFMNAHAIALGMIVPENAPPGVYDFIGRVGLNASLYVEDTFEFSKANDPTTDQSGSGYGVEWQVVGSWPTEYPLNSTSGNVTIPNESTLSAAYPNPFNAATRLSLTLKDDASDSRIVVYNISGREVLTVAEGVMSSGVHHFTISGEQLASGVYFVRAVVPGQLDETRKLVVLQ
jgi:Secretion system C-terminal sorting domain